MNLFTKTKYAILSRLVFVRVWYENLTKVNIMAFAISVLMLLLVNVAFHTQTIKWEVYKQEKHISRLTDDIYRLNNDVQHKDSVIVAVNTEHQQMKDFIKDVFTTDYYTTSLTGYHPVVEQCDSTPDITADGTKIDINRAGEYKYVALSRDLLTHFNSRGAKIRFGDYIMVKGTTNNDGIYQVRDTMNARHTEWIDILLTPGEKSFYYRNILMTKITNPIYISMLQDVYNFPTHAPLAMGEPEVKIN